VLAAHDCCVVIEPGESVVVVVELGDSELVVLGLVVAAELVVVVPIDPVQAMTLHAITKAASDPATMRRRIAETRRARSASSRRAAARLSSGGGTDMR